MKKITKNIFGLIIMVSISGVFYFTFAQTFQGELTFSIHGLGIRHGTPSNQQLGTISSSSFDQNLSKQFTEPFRIEDIEGYITGHYTTIQCAGVFGPNHILTGVELKAGSISPELIMGLTGANVHINPLLANYTNIIEPVTYIYKETNANNIGIVNKYGDKPRLKILIPPTAPSGVYSGTIVFSFYPE